MEGITEDFIKKCRVAFESGRGNKALQTAVCKRGVLEVATDSERGHDPDTTFAFSDELDQTWTVCDQKSSGRCWIFSALTVLRAYAMEHALGVKDFEFSQVYVFFWYKFERSGYFLDEIIRTADRPDGDRLVMFLIANPAVDGGQFDFFRAVVKKYGLVPKSVMPETYSSEHTGFGLRQHLNTVLRTAACQIRRAYRENEAAGAAKQSEAMQAIKREAMERVWTVLCMHLGTPPERFSYRWVAKPKDEESDDDKKDSKDKKEKDKKKDKKDSKDKKVVRDLCDITPLDFVKFCGFPDSPKTDFTRFVSVVHDPRATSPPMRSFTVESLSAVAGAPPLRYLNVASAQRLKDLAAAVLRDGHAVWFGADSGQYKCKTRGLFDQKYFDFASVYGFGLDDMDKAERLIYGDSSMCHAMAFTGVNIVDGKTRTWKVENSWGVASGNKGNYAITDEWFDQFVYEVAVPPEYLTEEERAAYASEPIVLPAWDPMGVLALSD